MAARGLPPDWTEEDLRRQGHDLDATQEPPIFRFFSSLAPLRMEMVVLRDGHFDVFDSAARSHFYSAFEISEMEKNYRPGAWNAVSIG